MMTETETAQKIVDWVGMKDAKPEPFTFNTPIGFCDGTTKCFFCNKSIHYNAVKSAPLYCGDCITTARKIVKRSNIK
jgi:hypothetical protein